MWNLKESLDSP